MKELLEFCKTARQEEVLTTVLAHGIAGAAEKLGLRRVHVKRIITRVQQYQALRDKTKHNGIKTAPGFTLKRVSIHTSKDGKTSGWHISEPEKVAQWEAMCAAVEELVEGLPSHAPIDSPKELNSAELLNMYTFSDYHLGMLAWHREGGRDWDMPTAIRLLQACFSDMLASSPDADACIINQLGDFAHYDSLAPLTPTSGHMLDADSRPEKMIQAVIACLDYLIHQALTKHEKVYVVIAQGNHDLFGSIWLKQTMMRLYRDNPRVQFVDSKNPFYAMRWGKSMLGFHHGHKVKFEKLPQLFMDEYRELYGTTDYTYIHMGHYHHHKSEAIGSTVVEMHSTLAARDAHASYGGYHARSYTEAITYHKEYGEFRRIPFYPEFY